MLRRERKHRAEITGGGCSQSKGRRVQVVWFRAWRVSYAGGQRGTVLSRAQGKHVHWAGVCRGREPGEGRSWRGSYLPVTSSWREKAFCGRSALHMPSPPTSTRDLQQERNILHFLKNCGKTHASFQLLVSLTL